MIACWLKRLAILFLLLLLQGPALVMQEIAWIGMLVSYSSQRGMMRGVAETFDGDHPCAMCHKADELKRDAGGTDAPGEKPREQLPSLPMAWAKMLPPSVMTIGERTGEDLVVLPWWIRQAMNGRCREAPATPPPRRA